jgi:hypothetical protein
MRLTVLLAALALLVLPGCSGKRTMRVWGEVTFDGRPVEQGEIEFKPVEGTSGPTTGGSISAGHYDVPAEVGPLAGGTYLVSINGYARTGRKIQTAPGHFVDALDNVIPEIYNRKSTLRVTIAPSAAGNQHDFKLEAKTGPKSP